ncbi:MAG: hypothetical protein R6V74_08890, partial [Lutibacter sp.]
RDGIALIGRQLQNVETQLAGRSKQPEPAALCRAGRLGNFFIFKILNLFYFLLLLPLPITLTVIRFE